MGSLFFIHGWPVNHNLFGYQFIELPDHGYGCIDIDLLGFSRSDKPWDGYNYDTMADDVKAVLDSLDLYDATLAGFSMGDSISIHYMSCHHENMLRNLLFYDQLHHALLNETIFHMVLINQ